MLNSTIIAEIDVARSVVPCLSDIPQGVEREADLDHSRHMPSIGLRLIHFFLDTETYVASPACPINDPVDVALPHGMSEIALHQDAANA